MSSHRSQHNSESVKREITAIIRKLNDPRISSKFISILKISASADSSSFIVFVTAMEGLETAQQAADGLNSAAGLIRKELGQKMRLRYVPNIKFVATDALEKGIELSKKIDEIVNKKNAENTEV